MTNAMGIYISHLQLESLGGMNKINAKTFFRIGRGAYW